MRKLKDQDIQRIWSRVKKLQSERETVRHLDRQMVEFDIQRKGFLVRRRDSKFTTA